LLKKEPKGSEAFVIYRTFDAPIELMYDMWSNLLQLLGTMGAALIAARKAT
jgi:hypothetical protein